MILRIIPDGVNFNFVKWGKVALIMSVLLTLGSLVLIYVRGINLGTDFAGGVVVDFQVADTSVDAERIKCVLAGAGLGSVSVQNFGEDPQEFMVVFKGGASSGSHVAVDKVKGALGELGEISYKKVDYVGAQIGLAQVKEGIIAVLGSLLCMFFYLCLRFRWQFAVGGVSALVHDVIITMGMISATGLEFSLPVMAAILMVIGYSVNDSVVIYDRVRELMVRSETKDMVQIVNTGINTTLSRTLLTSGTTMLAALPLMLLCEGAVQDLGIIAFFGVVVGTYSSIFVSTIPFIGSIQKALKLSSPAS
ncbi:protein-export membrane protein SecF [Anaplasma phagocytophilum str. ApMUC09]|uniref:Protein-export membrane protein SecF n=1 Tax=Anaplasma phagocytophilum str. ApMUC09 TaxID=1359152 RepID=A0A0F3N6A6_ANAPH|nr:protein-export membrane protein SecF [Anaplasma phagocytophilum str. ApMUC09]SCV63466.1 Protein-export membrane protein SecF [Anaplasma phagocytophilum]